jgi:hypothetical protein
MLFAVVLLLADGLHVPPIRQMFSVVCDRSSCQPDPHVSAHLVIRRIQKTGVAGLCLHCSCSALLNPASNEGMKGEWLRVGPVTISHGNSHPIGT